MIITIQKNSIDYKKNGARKRVNTEKVKFKEKTEIKRLTVEDDVNWMRKDGQIEMKEGWW